MRRVIGLTLGAVFVGLAAIALSVPHDPVPAPAAPNAKASPPVTAAPARRTVAGEDAAAPGELRFRRVIPHSEGDLPEACLIFSSALDASGTVRYADYVRVPDRLHPGFRVDGARLCLSGLSFGTSHEITLRKGLPGAKRETLPEDTRVIVDFGDRPASVSFSSGFVLPRETAEGLPVTTVNAEALDIEIHRVGDRLLSQMRSDFVDERRMYAYHVASIAREEGRKVWSGRMPVGGPRNEAVTSLFPLSQCIGKAEPGAYLVTARIPTAASEASKASPSDDDEDYGSVAAQWVVQSDLGLTSLDGTDGLSIVVRSLATAKPVAGARLTLIARNNDELAVIATGNDGKARFDPGLLRGEGGARPAMVMAYAGSDFNFIDLRRADFDLSDRGVSGRAPAGPADAFLYADRGIYRPGETVHLVALLRDASANALTGRSLVVKVNRPDGREYRRFVVSDQGAGGGHLAIRLPADANRGGWEATAHADPAGKAIGRLGFDVQDFVPQRLAIDLGTAPALLRPGEALNLPLTARFLYGAPADGLGGEGEIAVEADPAPFPAFKGFLWGRQEERFAGTRADLEVASTDAQGRTQAKGSLPAIAATTLPLRADIGIAVREPGGRTTSTRLTLPVRTRDVYVGIRPAFEGSVREGQEALFEVIAVDATGERLGGRTVDYRIFKDASTWQWYRSGSSWSYERVRREVEIASGRLNLDAVAPATLRRITPWGGYRLEVGDPASGSVSSVAYRGGWYGEASADRPDRLKVATDRAGYRPGDTARLRIDSEAAGEALLVIANERVIETRNLPIPAGGGEIAVPVAADWGPGAYALVTLYRPLSDRLGHAPVRAVGVAWIGLDPADRTLPIIVTVPPKAAPRQTLTLPLKVGNGGGKAFVTLAAVDQGILQLTRFKTPDPAGYFLSKRRLGVGLRDDYGRLIRGLSTAATAEGGDAFGGKGLDVVPTRSVALFSGVVETAPDGTAAIPLEIPDFQGELRLMAVAFDGRKVGSAEARLTVRDPLVAEVVLPRFLAPGDRAAATVLLHNVEAAPGPYRVRVTPRGALTGAAAERTVNLATGVRETFAVPVSAADAGIGEVGLEVSGPEGLSVKRAWPIQARPPQTPETRQTTQAMRPGESIALDSGVLEGFLPGTANASVSLSRWSGLDVPGLLRWLDRYPFGCLEQTTSRAMPLLDFNDVALLAGSAQDRNVEARVQEAIDRIAAMQSASGAFRMWGQWGDEALPWLSAFAMDFLYRAADRGFDVPEPVLALGRRHLNGLEGDARAYAFALLARRGFANAADLRYFHDHKPPTGPLALAHLGVALDAIGERARAKSAFDAAIAAFDAPSYDSPPYGGRLRDAYAVAALLAESGRGARAPEVLAKASAFDARAESTTTQEKAWMLRFAATAARNAGRLTVEADGKPLPEGDPAMLPLTAEALARHVVLHNAGEGEIFRTLSVEGVPAAPLPPLANGISLHKRILGLDGNPVDPQRLKRNDRVVVVMEGRIESETSGNYALIDLLPSGLEIEAPLRPDQPGYDWLGPLSPARMRQARDDRFVAALSMNQDAAHDPRTHGNLGHDNWSFRVAYQARAVTPGDFVLPSATAENMYVPTIRARTAMGRLTIVE
jgi:uncharacterized protein YfaS (alpha-2-macroglobulin family)